MVVATSAPTASTHIHPIPCARASCCFITGIQHLIGKVERAGYTLVPLEMHYRAAESR